jgi:hypothetical protein
MSDESQKPGRGAWLVVLGGVLLPLLYTLSVGPAAYMQRRTGGGGGWERIFYAPLIWLHDNTPLEKPLEWYTGQWEKLAE